jgi:hypothetical protein
VFTCIGLLAFISCTIWFVSGILEISSYNPNNQDTNAFGVGIILVLFVYSALIYGAIEIPTFIFSSISAAKKEKMGKILLWINIALVIITILYFIVFFAFGSIKGVMN